MNQQTLANMPPRKDTLKDWVERWLNDKYPEVLIAKPAPLVRREMYDDLPSRFLPMLNEILFTAWFTPAVQKILSNIKPQRSYIAERTNAGKVQHLIVQPMLFEIDDYRQYIIGKLVLSKGDIDAIERHVQQYAELHPGVITDTGAFVDELRSVVGL